MADRSKPIMERYTVTVTPPGGNSFRLLIPFAPALTVSALATEVQRRVARLGNWPGVSEMFLCLGEAGGPILDGDDILEYVIVDPKSEIIHASSQITTTTALPSVQPPTQTSGRRQEQEVKIRVITPSMAKEHKDIRTIANIRASITPRTTLREVKSLIATHLNAEVSGAIKDGGECNCSFARQIDEKALSTEARIEGSGSTSLKLIVVYGRNQVQILEPNTTDRNLMLEAVHREMGTTSDKEVNIFGGILANNQYSNMPVVSICSRLRHGWKPVTGSRAETCLDIHTAEAPIEISNLNIDLTLEELSLTGSAINGVINLYVVERYVSATGESSKESGKDAIFLDGDAWEHPVAQSSRGQAMLLSSLRVFSERVGARHLEPSSQDAILHLFHLLTRFPPAVRAMHILMNGKSPRPSERAALCQSIYEVLKDVVPSQLIKHDPKRVLEGSRLLFGLILEKAKHLKFNEPVRLPYISSMRVIDLRNSSTMEPVFRPVQTYSGIVEEGYYEALQQGGVLYWRTGEPPLVALPPDERTSRTALLCGGVISQITILDMNNLNSSTIYADKGDVNHVIPARELTDLGHLSALCSRNNLSVIPPASLPSADAPALTLDRNGHLAVYVGRAGCAEPGKDISIFRPLDGGEENVDVAIITQLIVPIIAEREVDGTAVFDAFGDGVRKFKAPDEILMVVVDCSQSMSNNSDFIELQNDDNDEDEDEGMDDSDEDIVKREPSTSAADGSTFFCATLDEMKTSLTEDESFDDMVCIVRDTRSERRRDVASKILAILSGLASRELSNKQKEAEALKSRVSRSYYRLRYTSLESDITKLKTLIAGLNTHQPPLCDFLIYRAVNSDVLNKYWTWRKGEEIPKIPKETSNSQSATITQEEFAIPTEFACPISRDVMDDPVTTCDGFTFERNTIERWFQIRRSSPLTGLELDNVDLRYNAEVANNIKTWISGGEIVAATSPTSPESSSNRSRLYSTRVSNRSIIVEFFSRLGSFKRQVPRTLAVKNLYQLAFRGIKGRHSKFQLHCNNVHWAPSELPLSSTNIRNKSVIHISVPDESTSTGEDGATASAEFEELCLIKVYDQYEKVSFSYWIPKKTTNTLASVIFRYWRHQFKGSPYYGVRLILPWTKMTNMGDERITGHPQDHWKKLSEFLNRQNATGILGDEPLYSNGKDVDDSDREVMDYGGPTPLVLKVFMGGEPAKPKDRSGKVLTRLDVLKSMFDALVNRLLAYNLQTHMGLITFQSTAKVSQPITHAVESFRHKVNGMKAEGDTALWDALALANDQIKDYAKKFPNAKKRILCISDGNDNKSAQKSSHLSLRLSENDVVVDSFCLGDEDNADLRTISYLSGGYKFKPESLEQAMAICEMEPVLTSLERPAITIPDEAHSHVYDPYLRFVFAKDKADPEIVTSDVFPQRKEHPNIKDHFVQLSSITGNSSGSGSVNVHSDSNLRTSRILTEIRNIVANPHPHYDVYLSESNMAFWKVVMQGPPESAYSMGTFVLYIDMEEDYPAFPPKCRFTTPIYHPNINRHGKVCHSILDRNWTSDTTNLQLINTIYSLLLVPEFSDPINAVVTLNFHWDEVAFQDEAKNHILKHATKSRAEWKAEILYGQ